MGSAFLISNLHISLSISISPIPQNSLVCPLIMLTHFFFGLSLPQSPFTPISLTYLTIRLFYFFIAFFIIFFFPMFWYINHRPQDMFYKMYHSLLIEHFRHTRFPSLASLHPATLILLATSSAISPFFLHNWTYIRIRFKKMTLNFVLYKSTNFVLYTYKRTRHSSIFLW